MKINPTRPTQSVRSTKAKKTSSANAFTPASGNEQQPIATMTGSSAIASVDALIALQAEPEIKTVIEKATMRANSLLGILDTIRISLLDGGIPERTLKQLLSALGEQREETGDPALEAILEQVEVRAQVELAKLETIR
ncbi:MAG: flagellar assembly protein FliX [Robiginitomaculum sp.]|nr:flagellar assembly protein FliX [Robiginitomaculum sp.]